MTPPRSAWKALLPGRPGIREPHCRKCRKKKLSKAAFVDYASRLLRGHPPVYPLRLLRPVIELVIDRQQEHFDTAERVLIVWQPFAVMVGTDWVLFDDRADQAGFFKRFPSGHLSPPEAEWANPLE